MRRRAATAVLMIGLAAAGCGGKDDSDTAEPPAETAAPPSAPNGSALPPEFTACMADRGYAIESADDVHSAPQAVLQECFGSLHGGGGGP